MGDNNMDLINKNFLQEISEFLESARKKAKTAVNRLQIWAPVSNLYRYDTSYQTKSQ